MQESFRTIADILQTGNSFLVAAHSSPDGDAMGSTVALGHILLGLKKQVVLYNASGMPDTFAWLDSPVPVTATLPAKLPQWTIALDCGSKQRLGKALAQRFNKQGTINIDHHLGNPAFGAVNWVDPDFSSVGEMIARLAQACDIPLRGGLGQAVNLALVSDTGHFSFSNTQPETLELSAAIMRQGLNIGEFTESMQNQWTLNRLHLWSHAFGSVELHLCDTVASITITGDMLESTGTTKEDCDGLINTVRRIRGVRIALLLREENARRSKFSLRSTGDVNVQAIASELGGGGHKNASGGMLELPISQAKQRILEITGKHIACSS